MCLPTICPIVHELTGPMAHPLLESAQRDASEFVALRRDIHRHPELGLHEVRTGTGGHGAMPKTRIKALVRAQAKSFGVTAHVNDKRDCPVLANSPAETAFALAVGIELLGTDGWPTTALRRPAARTLP